MVFLDIAQKMGFHILILRGFLAQVEVRSFL